MLKSYSGALGKFEYDDNDFTVCFDEQGQYLHYTGQETDGGRISVPKGLTDGRMLFESTDIVSQPVLPSGLKSMDGMFMGCDKMIKAGNIPDGVENCRSAYSYCIGMQNSPDMPDSVLYGDFMYDGCKSMSKAGRVSSKLQTADCMYANCEKLSDLPALPLTVRSKDSVFLNSDNLPQSIEAIDEDEYDYDEMFGGLEDVKSEDIAAKNIETNLNELVENSTSFFSKKVKRAGKAAVRDYPIEFGGLSHDFSGPEY